MGFRRRYERSVVGSYTTIHCTILRKVAYLTTSADFVQQDGLTKRSEQSKRLQPVSSNNSSRGSFRLSLVKSQPHRTWAISGYWHSSRPQAKTIPSPDQIFFFTWHFRRCVRGIYRYMYVCTSYVHIHLEREQGYKIPTLDS